MAVPASKYFKHQYYLSTSSGGMYSDLIYELLRGCHKTARRDHLIDLVKTLCERGCSYSNEDFDVLGRAYDYIQTKAN